MFTRTAAGIASVIVASALVIGAGPAAGAAVPGAPVPGDTVALHYADAPVLGPRDYVTPTIQNLEVRKLASGFSIEFDVSSVASPTIPGTFYGGDLILTGYVGTGATPVPASPVFGPLPDFYETLDTGLPETSATPQTGHYSHVFALDRAESHVLALYATQGCDNTGGPVGCGGSDALYASAVLGATGGFGVDRVAGADRYESAVKVSQNSYERRAETVVIATGANYPDALSAGPAAARLGGPLLLTATDTLYPAVKSEIQRLGPERIVVVGGANSISPSVFDQLKGLQTNTVRIGGADRYEASRNLAVYAFGESGAATAYVATGSNFPDALSAGAAAATNDGPVLLVNGTSGTLDAASALTLSTLKVKTAIIAGGPNSVSSGIQSDLGSLPTVTSVLRDGGADRYSTSVNINLRAFPTATHAFIATGQNFPDALSGSAWAGLVDAPLFVVNTNCVPQGTLAAITQERASNATLLGGPNTLTAAVQTLTPCAS